MYRPPQNTNRVKLIRKKFENVENTSPESASSRDRSYLTSPNFSEKSNGNGKKVLERQLSDPSRRNIKRTPAFRVDRSVDHSGCFQRNGFNQSTLYESKVKQFSAVKSNCDKNLLSKEKSESKPLLNNILNDEKGENKPLLGKKNVPLLIKSKSSLDFKYIKSKFDTDITNNNCHKSTNSTEKSFDISLLYTEPIPKALRRNNSNCTDFSSSPSPITSDKIESSFSESPILSDNFDSIYSLSTLKIDDLADINKRDLITDTLKIALSKPLPPGPAPKKPPRAFQVAKEDLSSQKINNSPKILDKKPLIHPKMKSDPKYMLLKLEDALRNNKLRSRKSPKTDLTLTSGEDSDDSLLSRTKSNRSLPRIPTQENINGYNNSSFNLNCLNGFKFVQANYEKIKEPNSCFFVGSPKEEPVYAEPFHYRKDSLDSAVIRRGGSSRSKQSARNSLYYMSTPLLTAGGAFIRNMTESPDKQVNLRSPVSLSHDSLFSIIKE